MANSCRNEFHAVSDNPKTLEYISKYLIDNFDAYVNDDGESCIYADFDSKWVFPKESMEEMFEGIEDKSDIYMRCLSVEYGCDYVDYWKCEDEKGWYCAL